MFRVEFGKPLVSTNVVHTLMDHIENFVEQNLSFCLQNKTKTSENGKYCKAEGFLQGSVKTYKNQAS